MLRNVEYWQPDGSRPGNPLPILGFPQQGTVAWVPSVAPSIATTQDSSAVLGARPRNARGIEPLRMWMWRRPRPPPPCRVVRVHRCRQFSHSAGSFPTTRAWDGGYGISSLTELFCRSKNGLGRFGERLVGHGVEPPCRWALHLTLGLSVPFPELFFSSKGGYHLRASSGVLLMPSLPDDGMTVGRHQNSNHGNQSPI